METTPQEVRLDKLEGIVTNMIISQQYSIRKMKKFDKKLNVVVNVLNQKFKKTDQRIRKTTNILNQKFQETDQKFQETDQKLEKTTDILNQKFQETDLKFKETDLKFKETVESFKETDLKFKETDLKFKETAHILDLRFGTTIDILNLKFSETDLKFKQTAESIDKLTTKTKNINLELGGIGKTNGLIAESIFYRYFKSRMRVEQMLFDYIDRNVHRKKDDIEGEYDIILYNDNKILVVEVKYFFRINYLKKFYQTELEKFKILFPNYVNYKIYGAIAAIHFEDEVLKEAKKIGLYIFKEEDKQITIINDPEFMPTDINKISYSEQNKENEK